MTDTQINELDTELREAFEAALSERYRIEGPLNGFGQRGTGSRTA